MIPKTEKAFETEGKRGRLQDLLSTYECEGISLKSAGLDPNQCDEVSLKLCGLIGTFDLIVNLLSGDRNINREKATMLDFAFFVSNELQVLYKMVAHVEYNS